jgi:hypothetical protein
MERTVCRMTPLVSELQGLCQSLEEGGRERRAAAWSMLWLLRHEWADLPVIDLPGITDEERNSGELLLIIVRDVGEVADILLTDEDVETKLAWARANLIVDLERYLLAVELASGKAKPCHGSET